MQTSINHTDIQRGIERAHEIRSLAAHKSIRSVYVSIRNGILSLRLPKISIPSTQPVSLAKC